MKYQLVFQYSEDQESPFEFIEKTGEIIEKALKYSSEFDGHDLGQGEINFFIHTNFPEKEFENLRSVLVPNNFKVAYRDFEEEEYIVLYPKGSKFSIA